MSVREKRLRNDFQALSALVNNSGATLEIISHNREPAYQYVIEYRCRGIEKLENNRPVFRTTHRVEITLGNNYPKDMPTAKFLTPIFHPNVFDNLKVCLGNTWTMAETLPELVLRIGKIIQYGDDITNLKSPANSTAKSWAEKNMQSFPVDTQTFKSQIVWDELPVTTPSDGKINISFQDF
ncbi:MAG: ubiquitin-conjugating enzyme E2 [Aulosira sp. DedQUE10]|nr:ubiquitin-conjugating enzyme E2 [Aulosira sp. DedQUE10]